MALLSLSGPPLTTLFPNFYTAASIAHLVAEGFLYTTTPNIKYYTTISYATYGIDFMFSDTIVHYVVTDNATSTIQFVVTIPIVDSLDFETTYNDMCIAVKPWQI